eukprot:914046-Pelagomonas_calceolata.AAC.3
MFESSNADSRAGASDGTNAGHHRSEMPALQIQKQGLQNPKHGACLQNISTPHLMPRTAPFSSEIRNSVLERTSK